MSSCGEFGPAKLFSGEFDLQDVNRVGALVQGTDDPHFFDRHIAVDVLVVELVHFSAILKDGPPSPLRDAISDAICRRFAEIS